MTAPKIDTSQTWEDLVPQLYEAIQGGTADEIDLRGFLDAWASYETRSHYMLHREPANFYGSNPEDWPAWTNST